MGMKKYNTEEERKQAKRESERKRYYKNKEKILAKHAEYYQNNREKIAEYNAEYKTEYRSTPFGRANNLISSYRLSDKKQNRGECTIDAQWIVDNVFSGQVCHYCGETDWMKLGCDRIDNSLPHTPDNVVCSCWDCNNKRKKTPYDEFMRMIGKVA